MSNKSRTIPGLIGFPGAPYVMVNENSNNLTSFKYPGVMVTQNNGVTNPQPPVTTPAVVIVPSLSLTGFGS